MKRAVAFLHGPYRRRDLPFYRGLLDRALTVAVDGGYRFFRTIGVFPDVLIGDFDSLRRMPRDLPADTKVIRHETRKNKTDAHLALEFCLATGAAQIDLVMPECGELDHAIGTIMLLGLDRISAAGTARKRVRIVGPRYEIRLVHNEATSFSNCVADMVSVVPLSRLVKLSCTGTDYDVVAVPLRFGESRGLRNRIAARRAVFRLEGKGLVIHRFGSARR